ADQRPSRQLVEPARQRNRQVAWRRGYDLTAVLAGCGDRIDEVDEIVGGMLALAGKRLIAAPIDRDVEPGEQVAMVEPGEIARAGVLQDGPRLGMLAQIDREIELLGREALVQLLPIRVGQFQFTQCRTRVKE